MTVAQHHYLCDTYNAMMESKADHEPGRTWEWACQCSVVEWTLRDVEQALTTAADLMWDLGDGGRIEVADWLTRKRPEGTAPIAQFGVNPYLAEVAVYDITLLQNARSSVDAQEYASAPSLYYDAACPRKDAHVFGQPCDSCEATRSGRRAERIAIARVLLAHPLDPLDRAGG